MLGAIIGDIVGSHYEVLEINAIQNNPDKKRTYEERISILNPKVDLFTDQCSYTDDSVLTIAIASSIISDMDYESSLRKYGTKEISLGLDKYGRSRFGRGFVNWLQENKEGNSYGNGGAMRISPVGFYFNDIKSILEETKLATIPSHNHDDAITGAEAVTTAIYFARKGYSKKAIKTLLEFYFDYNLNFSLNELQHNYRFSSRTSKSVPQAIFCFLESSSFEDAIRKSISIGGDSDTIAAITGSISEAYYGIPEELKEHALSFLPPEYIKVVKDFYEELELRKALKTVNIEDDDFIRYMRSRVKRYEHTNPDSLWGYFTEYNEEGYLCNIRLLVPHIVDEKSLLINIHEYTHAYEAYQKLGTKYEEKVEESEALAKENEEKYLAKKKLYE